MRGYLSILDKLPNRLTGSVNNLLGVPPCEIQALSNAGGIPLELLVLLLTSAVSGPVLSIGVFLVSFFFVGSLLSLVGVFRFLFSPRFSFCDDGVFVELFCKWFSKNGGNCSYFDKFPNVLTLFDSPVTFSLLYSAISSW